MINEKHREGVAPWDTLHSRADIFPAFFDNVLELKYSNNLSTKEKAAFVTFLINAFASLEDEMVRTQCLA
jgi:intron-binding protein aquarius